jgi:hypothetical protein
MMAGTYIGSGVLLALTAVPVVYGSLIAGPARPRPY